MIDPIIPFLGVIVAALVLVGTTAGRAPIGVAGFLTTGLSGLGALLCLPPLLLRLPPTECAVPIGPPGLSLHLALDPLSCFFLLLVFVCGTAGTAAMGTAQSAEAARAAALGLAGTALTLLAADAVSLTLGLGLASGATFGNAADRGRGAALLSPLLVFTGACLLAPAGLAPGFESIQSEPAGPLRGITAAILTVTGIALWLHRPSARCPSRDWLIAGALLPTGSYVLLRVVVDLSGAAQRGWWGLPLLLAGSALAVWQAWGAARHPDIDGAVAGLARRQAGLAAIGVGLLLLARAADLPEAQALALQGTLLLAIGSALGGTLTSLAAHAIGGSAGTYRLSRLGGLVHLMPATSFGLGAGLLSLAALPPGLGFTCLWLSFQAILMSPRTGGMHVQISLATAAAAIALSAGISTAACVRLVGIAVLGRPRTPRAAGAREAGSPARGIMLAMAVAVLLAGLLPSVVIAIAAPAIRATVAAGRWPSPYPILPMTAILALAGLAVALPGRRKYGPPRPSLPWNDGLGTPFGLDFGDPAAQASAGGFLPPLPRIAPPVLPRLPALRPIRGLSSVTALWIVLLAFGAFLLIAMIAG